jgi:hypothetical protein
LSGVLATFIKRHEISMTLMIKRKSAMFPLMRNPTETKRCEHFPYDGDYGDIHTNRV